MLFDYKVLGLQAWVGKAWDRTHANPQKPYYDDDDDDDNDEFFLWYGSPMKGI